VKNALLKNPFLGGVIRAADYLINDQADALLPACRERLGRGETVLIFSEGTRSVPGQPLTLQRGAANIAVRCNSDLRVVHIYCSEHLLDKHSRWFDVPPRKPLFNVVVRERIRCQEFFDPSQDHEPALAARKLNRHLLYQLTPGLMPGPGNNDASALR